MKTLSPSCWTRLSSIWHFRNSVYCCGPLDSLEKVICKQFFFCGFNCPITFQDLLHKFLCANMATPIVQDRLFSKLYSAQCPHYASLLKAPLALIHLKDSTCVAIVKEGEGGIGNSIYEKVNTAGCSAAVMACPDSDEDLQSLDLCLAEPTDL